jgi:beta-glucosidase
LLNPETSRRNFCKTSAVLGGGSMESTGAESATSAERLRFSSDFLLGASTSAHAVEGAWNADGKGESIWDRWTHIPGRVPVNADSASDHYRRFGEDILLMKQMGLRAYRFSVAWTRIFPDGAGSPNARGLSFYRGVLSRLAEAGITPIVTLSHWDLPQKLQDRGGWTNRDTADAFENYARVLFHEFGGLSPLWATFDEPWAACFMGYHHGSHPPGLRDFSAALLAAHHVLLGHGMAVGAFRDMGTQGRIGIFLDGRRGVPRAADPAGLAAAEREPLGPLAWFADPIFKGRYPEDIREWTRGRAVLPPDLFERDAPVLRRRIDFLGLHHSAVSAAADDPAGGRPAGAEAGRMDGERTDSPDSDELRSLLAGLRREYDGVPILVEVNGVHGGDFVNPLGEVDDDGRIRSLARALRTCRAAVEEGENLIGFLAGPLLDDVDRGEHRRGGLVYVDFETFQRIVKKSGWWFGRGIREGFAV